MGSVPSGLQAYLEKKRQEKLNGGSKGKSVPSKEAGSKTPPKMTPAMRKVAKMKTEGKKPMMKMSPAMENMMKEKHSPPVGSPSLVPAPEGGGSITINVNA